MTLESPWLLLLAGMVLGWAFQFGFVSSDLRAVKNILRDTIVPALNEHSKTLNDNAKTVQRVAATCEIRSVICPALHGAKPPVIHVGSEKTWP